MAARQPVDFPPGLDPGANDCLGLQAVYGRRIELDQVPPTPMAMREIAVREVLTDQFRFPISTTAVFHVSPYGVDWYDPRRSGS